MNAIKKYVAEFIGTFVLVLFACGTAAVVKCNGADPNTAYLMTALSFGLVIVAMAYSIGNISGCHINPAVSIAMLVNGKITLKDFIGYIVAQFAGAIAGAAVLMAIVGVETGLGTNGLYNGNIGLSFVIEVILTFVFVIGWYRDRPVSGAGAQSGHCLHRYFGQPCPLLRPCPVCGRRCAEECVGVHPGSLGGRRAGCADL